MVIADKLTVRVWVAGRVRGKIGGDSSPSISHGWCDICDDICITEVESRSCVVRPGCASVGRGCREWLLSHSHTPVEQQGRKPTQRSRARPCYCNILDTAILQSCNLLVSECCQVPSSLYVCCNVQQDLHIVSSQRSSKMCPTYCWHFMSQPDLHC